MANFNMFGRNISITKQEDSYTPQNKKMVNKAIQTLKTYMNDKAELDNRIIENERWYRLQHWDMINGQDGKQSGEEPEPVTGFLFSTLVQKHSDYMDNYPIPTTLPREESDIDTSDTLTEILPVILRLNDFKNTYSLVCWDKLKHGFGVYGTFWDNNKSNGLGDVSVEAIDILGLYWEMGVDNMDDSDNVFLISLLSEKKLQDDFSKKSKGKRIVEPKRYAHSKGDISEMTVVVDWYYKKTNDQGKKVLHLCKFIDSNDIIFMSEEEPEYAENGIEPLNMTEDEPHELDVPMDNPQNMDGIPTDNEIVGPDYISNGFYEHGKFPFDIDVLFPDKASMVGFGYIDLLKSPQIYIDKLDQIITTNAYKAGKVRHFVKRDGFVNPDDINDYEKELIETNGFPSEVVKQFQLNTLDTYIITHRQSKIDELKEIAANNEFNRGEGGKGVTAASAIQLLVEEGNKTSRDMISHTYYVLENVFAKVIEILAQFYDESRTFRITKPNGGGMKYNNKDLQYKFTEFNNKGLKEQPIDMPQGVNPEQYGLKFRKPVFDIEVVAEKRAPHQTAAYNAMAMEFFNNGFFNPDRALEALAAIELMQFDGQEGIKETITKNNSLIESVKAMQQNMEQLNNENTKLKAIVQNQTGRNLGVNEEAVRKGLITNG